MSYLFSDFVWVILLDFCRILCYPICSCTKKLDCGHMCSGKCSKCSSSNVHPGCTFNCERLLLCTHTCAGSHVCSTECPPCQKKGVWKCWHTKCNQVCSAILRSCREPCNLRCYHSRCTRQCFQLCNRWPCNWWHTLFISVGNQLTKKIFWSLPTFALHLFLHHCTGNAACDWGVDIGARECAEKCARLVFTVQIKVGSVQLV